MDHRSSLASYHHHRSVFCRSEEATKTDDPRRVTVVEPLAQVLAQQRRWLTETQHPGLGSGLIFPASPRHARGGAERRGVEGVSWYRSPSVMEKPLARLSEAGKLPPISPQSLRRTWENLLREAGIDQLVRRALWGWRTEKAQAIYATVDRQAGAEPTADRRSRRDTRIGGLRWTQAALKQRRH
jgi:hypothetical protein